MKSRASIKSHPIHQMLIPFPLASLWGSLLFDLLGRVMDRPALWTTGGHLAIVGVITALVAAIPGFLDYVHTVPPDSTGKTRATRHMMVNLSAVGLMALAWWLRDDVTLPPGAAELAAKAGSVILVTVGGWMGGTLVVRNQIGVDHRYARAGKWSEESFQVQPGTPFVVAKVDDLQPNQMRLLHVNGRRIVLARTENGYAAFDDSCTHRGGSLADGVLMCGRVQCPWHGSQFDVKTGAVHSGPARESIAAYRVEQRSGEVRLTLEEDVKRE